MEILANYVASMVVLLCLVTLFFVWLIKAPMIAWSSAVITSFAISFLAINLLILVGHKPPVLGHPIHFYLPFLVPTLTFFAVRSWPWLPVMSHPNRTSQIGRRLISLGIAVPVGIVLITLVSAIDAGTSADRGMGVGLMLLVLIVVGVPVMTLSAGIGTVLMSNALLRRDERRELKDVVLCFIGALLAAAGLILTIAVAARFVAHG